MTIYIALVLLALAGICLAVMDTLLHHWPGSIFAKWSGGDPLHWWGDAYQAYKRRHENNDPTQPKKWWFKTAIASFFAEPFNDAWHFFKLLKFVFVAASVGVFTFSLLNGVFAFLVYAGMFTLVYKLLDAEVV